MLNTSYSKAETSVLSVVPTTDILTVGVPDWGTLIVSTPILFGADASAYGSTPPSILPDGSTPETYLPPTLAQFG